MYSCTVPRNTPLCHSRQESKLETVATLLDVFDAQEQQTFQYLVERLIAVAEQQGFEG